MKGRCETHREKKNKLKFFNDVCLVAITSNEFQHVKLELFQCNGVLAAPEERFMVLVEAARIFLLDGFGVFESCVHDFSRRR